MREFADMDNLAVWYARLEIEQLLDERADALQPRAVRRTRRALAKAHTRDSMSAFEKLTHVVDGQVKIVDQSPLIVPIDVLIRRGSARGVRRGAQAADCGRIGIRSSPTGAFCSSNIELVDFARKVVGVGSVGTRAWIALFIGRDGSDPLFLQMKEAEASVFEEFLTPSEYSNHGERVVTGQRLMQASSDIFLGWLHVDAGIDGRPRDFYGRQLRDWKGSVEIEQMIPEGDDRLRAPVRLDARPRPRPHRRPGGDRLLPRQRQ